MSDLIAKLDELRRLATKPVMQEPHYVLALHLSYPALREQIVKLTEALEAVHKEFESPSRNTNRGLGYRQAVCISDTTRELVRAALQPATETGGVTGPPDDYPEHLRAGFARTLTDTGGERELETRTD